jgi:phenylacetate-CoA ligase
VIICGVAAGWVEIDSALVDSLEDLLTLVCEHNPFQRARLAGADPAALPLLTKRELLDDQALHPPFGTNLTYPVERYVRLFQTSGLTGPPLKVLDTAADWAWRRERYEHTLRAAGVRPGDRVALAFSFGPYAHGWNSSEGLAGVGALAVPLGGMSSVQRLQTIAEVEATVVWCTPTYALRLLEVAMAERLEAALESVRLVLCGGEPGASLPGTRARIEEGFGARCLEHFGLTEVGPLAYPCSSGHGMHVDERDFVCEFLGAGLEPVPPDERGELVVTPLRRTGFPVLRYRTGDVVVRSASRCPAGHADLWLPHGIAGRADDMVVIRGTNVYPSAIEEAVRHVSGSGEYRITFYSAARGMDEIKLEVELPEGGGGRELQDEVRRRLGVRVRVVPVAAGLLPRPEGKARRVVDVRTPLG